MNPFRFTNLKDFFIKQGLTPVEAHDRAMSIMMSDEPKPTPKKRLKRKEDSPRKIRMRKFYE